MTRCADEVQTVITTIPGSLQMEWYALQLIKMRDRFNKDWEGNVDAFHCMLDIQNVLLDMVDGITVNYIKKRIMNFQLI